MQLSSLSLLCMGLMEVGLFMECIAKLLGLGLIRMRLQMLSKILWWKFGVFENQVNLN